MSPPLLHFSSCMQQNLSCAETQSRRLRHFCTSPSRPLLGLSPSTESSAPGNLFCVTSLCRMICRARTRWSSVLLLLDFWGVDRHQCHPCHLLTGECDTLSGSPCAEQSPQATVTNVLDPVQGHLKVVHVVTDSAVRLAFLDSHGRTWTWACHWLFR